MDTPAGPFSFDLDGHSFEATPTSSGLYSLVCKTCEVVVHDGAFVPRVAALAHVQPVFGPIERFYWDQGVDGSGRSFNETLALTDVSLEAVHDWVQWVFPLPERSGAQPHSPVLTPEELERFRTDPVLRGRAEDALARFSQFLDRTTRWVQKKDHNHLRITRVIRFLTIIGMPEPAHALYRRAASRLAGQGLLLERTDWYWRTALKPTSEAWPPEWAAWAAQ